MLIMIFDADHEASIGSSLTEVFRSLGHRTVLTTSSTSAEKLFGAFRFGMVILNKTPHRTEEVAKIAKEAMQRQVKTVLISTHRPNGIQCNQFIQAPFDLEVLERTVLH